MATILSGAQKPSGSGTQQDHAAAPKNPEGSRVLRDEAYKKIRDIQHLQDQLKLKKAELKVQEEQLEIQQQQLQNKIDELTVEIQRVGFEEAQQTGIDVRSNTLDLDGLKWTNKGDGK